MNKKKGGRIAAVIDIGSNMLRMRIAQLRKNEIVDLDRLEYPVSLGHEVFSNGKVSFESLRELSSVLQGYSEIMREYGVDLYRIVATTALREAKNRAYVLDQLKIQNDMTVEVLEDDQEKTLIYSEILESMKGCGQGIDNALISYIGAGTIGLAVYNGTNMIFSQNIPMGSLKLHDMLGSIQEQTEDFSTVVMEYLDAIVGHLGLPLNESSGLSSLILTGNEIPFIAKICGAELEDGRYVFKAQQLKNLFKEIRPLSQEKISVRYDINEETAELLYSALAIYARLIKFTKAETIISPQAELWSALMRLMLIPKSKPLYFEHVRENAISCAQSIAASYHCNQNHAENIRIFACRIFDRMKNAHGLGRRERLLLELAAILHDCGHYVNSKEHLMSSFDLIKHMNVYGMTDNEMFNIAYVSRYNEYDVPNFDDYEFSIMSDDQRLLISKLVAIFRLANSLDKSQKQKLPDIKVKLERNRLQITGETNDNIYLEKWAFEQTAPFFQEVFGIRPEFTVKSSLL